MKFFNRYFFTLCALLATLPVASEERINMEGISIIGNKELPNILYIVPWKSANLPEMVELPLSTLINDALEPIDRKALLREQYYQQVLNKKNIKHSSNKHSDLK